MNCVRCGKPVVIDVFPTVVDWQLRSDVYLLHRIRETCIRWYADPTMHAAEVYQDELFHSVVASGRGQPQ